MSKWHRCSSQSYLVVSYNHQETIHCLCNQQIKTTKLNSKGNNLSIKIQNEHNISFENAIWNNWPENELDIVEDAYKSNVFIYKKQLDIS
jgi:hypothetical protein